MDGSPLVIEYSENDCCIGCIPPSAKREGTEFRWQSYLSFFAIGNDMDYLL
ncbi:hypothetical protein CPter91_4086 [Collimonas pratensis]|uniref:Uncharacterized protein n=1 Tax=Collimonas pratensis TaxID=279113 RepID=A0A127Q8T6_9BURK|nr:hypothetical protein CPter91_4086 [Collimonas pratensis]